MKCNNCSCIFPSTYKLCPVCQSADFEREKFKVIEKEVEEVETVSPYVVDGDIDDVGGNL